MNNNNLSKRLKQELARNKKQTAILGVLLLVALYFWAPLIGRWVGAAEQDSSAERVEVLSGQTASKPGGAADTESQREVTPLVAAADDWQQLAERIRTDVQLQPLSPGPGLRDPFLWQITKQSLQEPAQNEHELPIRPVAAVTPEALGLKLEATMVGAARQTARINGRAYQPGETIDLTPRNHAQHRDRDGGQEVAQQGVAAMRIVAIRPSFVVMERNGQQFMMELQPVMSRPKTGVIEISTTSN